MPHSTLDLQNRALGQQALQWSGPVALPDRCDLPQPEFWTIEKHAPRMDSQATIFLVEDDTNARESLTWFLESYGYRVVPSGTIAEALAVYDPKRPGCLILDVQLPEGTGLELYEKFRALGGTHPFIVMTAYGRVPLAVEAMRLGAVDFLEKPFENQQLLARVKEAIAQDESARQLDKKGRQLDEEAQGIRRRLEQLGPREWQVAKLVAAGQYSKEIAQQLGIKRKTVDAHRQNIVKKLGVESFNDVIALVTRAQTLRDLGLLDLPE